MESVFHREVDWGALFARSRFRYIFAAMFISLFGTGMNYAGVTWYILETTQSTLNVSWMLILVTAPGLIVPAFGGVLIDRMDRRQLGVVLDLARGAVVLSAAALGYWGQARLWHIYTMMTLLGIGFAVYWSTLNALVQEVVAAEEPDPAHPPGPQLAAANSAVLIAVQGGMMAAGGAVGFLYKTLGIAGILAIDGATYLTSALCLVLLREGRYLPHARPAPPTIEAPPGRVRHADDSAVLPPIVEPGIVLAFITDLKEGLRYLQTQPRVFALGLTYACMMAGVISSHVLIVVLARDILRADAIGYGLMETGWALGAVSGGLLIGVVARRFSATGALFTSLLILAVGHAVFPYARFLAVAVGMNAVFGACRAFGGVLTQTSIMAVVPPRLMGRTQSAFSAISTLLQMAMSFSLGWVAQHVNVPVAFALLGAMYGGAAAAAFRARGQEAPEPEPI